VKTAAFHAKQNYCFSSKAAVAVACHVKVDEAQSVFFSFTLTD
jgi:hypothetical protein